LKDCPGCDEDWFVDGTLQSWYAKYNTWTKGGSCQGVQKDSSTTPGWTIPPNRFYFCLAKFLSSDQGRRFGQDIVQVGTPLTSDYKITGYREKIQVKKIDQVAKQGVEYLSDKNMLEAEYGLEGMFSYAQEMLDYELYVVFMEETLLSTGLSVLAVFFVVLFVTGSLPVTLLVVLAVLLVDLFLIALIHFWDLTFNTVVVVNIVIAIGLAVDYSAHIAHTYLIIRPPKDLSNAEKRVYKAKMALSTMGSSVFHGGFSTFLAIISLSSAQSYVFVVFFRLWFGIIVFGMSNGFLLLPVILSYIGPLNDDDIAGVEDANAAKVSSEKDIEMKTDSKLKDDANHMA